MIIGAEDQGWNWSTNILIVFAVPRWGEAETNGNGELKDIELLLRSDKAVVPKLDSWYVQFMWQAIFFVLFLFNKMRS